MPRRRRQSQGLERVLGTPALFATAYGNVGSSIYYALGVTAVFALGLTPLVFVIAGLIFAATAATYAEGTVRFPEAGGSSSFARHAFNELVTFGAAWAQMLNYIITIAISAFFVPHYLSIFWGPLKENPWDIVGGIVVIVLLVLLNIVGIKEAASLNIFLAVVDFATQLLLVLLGFALIFSPHVLTSNIHFGVAPTWGNFFLAIPVAMIAYTGIETVSNLAEEARDPVARHPALDPARRDRRLRDLLHAAADRALGAAGQARRRPLRDAARPAARAGGLRERPGARARRQPRRPRHHCSRPEDLRRHPRRDDPLHRHERRRDRRLADHLRDGELPAAARRSSAACTRASRRPWLALVVFAGVISILALLPGKVDFLGTMYSFGAMLSFTVAHVSVIVALRVRRRDEELVYRARPNLRIRGVDWPLFAIVGGLGTAGSPGSSSSSRTPPRAGRASAGSSSASWSTRSTAAGSLKMPAMSTIARPALVLGPVAARSSTGRSSCRSCARPSPRRRSSPPRASPPSAARQVADRARARGPARPAARPPSLPDEERGWPTRLLDDAQALVESYGVRAVTRLERARSAGEAIVADADARTAELVVIGAPRRGIGRRAPVFGRTVRYVLKHSSCRVIVVAEKVPDKVAA